MLHTFTKSLVGAAALAILGTAATAADWRGWNIHADGYPNTVAMDKFAELLADKTGGAFVAAGDAAELKSALQKVVDEVEKEEPEPKPEEKEAEGPGTVDFTMLVSEGGEEGKTVDSVYWEVDLLELEGTGGAEA